MESNPLRIELSPGPDDGPLRSPEYQQTLREFEESLRKAGLSPSVGVKQIDAAAGISPAVYSGGFSVGVAALTVLGTVVNGWIKGKAGRKVSLKLKTDGTIEADTRSVQDMERLLFAAKKYQESCGDE